MSRKITSLMVLLAAVLLALPTQAQTAAKAKRIAFARNHVATSMQKGNLLTSAFVNTQKSYIVRADAAKQAADVQAGRRRGRRRGRTAQHIAHQRR